MFVRKIWEYIRNFLDLNKVEQRGLVILMSIILIVILVRFFFPFITSDKSLSKYVLTQNNNSIDSLKKILIDVSVYDTSEKQKFVKKYYPNQNHKNSFVTSKQITPFKFNPNNMTIQQWLNMGFTEKQAEMIQKYRSAGGEFYTKEDLSKLWCISNNEYKILEPYILLPSKNDSIYINRFKQNATKPSKINIIEINTASEEKLMEIPGIGKYYAEQIIKYRRRLGGYCSKQQLMEIYNMDSSKYNKISKYISINANVIRKININTASFEDLQKHPYFTYNTSLALINYRETHGKFNKIEDIKKCDLFTQELYIKLIPYIKIE